MFGQKRENAARTNISPGQCLHIPMTALPIPTTLRDTRLKSPAPKFHQTDRTLAEFSARS